MIPYQYRILLSIYSSMMEGSYMNCSNPSSMEIVQFNGVLSSCDSDANIFILYFSTSSMRLL